MKGDTQRHASELMLLSSSDPGLLKNISFKKILEIILGFVKDISYKHANSQPKILFIIG